MIEIYYFVLVSGVDGVVELLNVTLTVVSKMI